MSDSSPVAVVTGASRGAGRGIAVALGSHGCTVYVTGRSQREGDASIPGTIYATADEVTKAGGRGIPVRVDHADDAQVRALFDQVEREQGRLDILVNNACAIHDQLPAPGPFWEKPREIGEMINVGVKSGFDASWYAAPTMVGQGGGLIVFTSAPGAVHYCFGPAYGAHKAGVDKMAADMAVDFDDAGVDVAAVSIWMGSLATERLLGMMAAAPEHFKHLEGTLESPEFTGHVIWALFNDPDRKALSGKTLIGAELGVQYGVTDIGGKYPPSVRELHQCAPREQYPFKVK
ncbi:SDR family NAD(P)-dependent oxidoreductase [Phenylobacterium sp. LjRoot219]|uniref:SDR family NAD(P)-dependent oxidoreductase n=1 Tax=Phenylobacterium sp. LjRoot219 TaxID=3342283 RepID=UPI003ECEC67D